MEKPKELKINSDIRNPLNYKNICQRNDTLTSTDGAFGMAYDIDNLPKIMMVHTLDRASEKFEEKCTFIDICSEGTLNPFVVEYSKESNQALKTRHSDEGGSFPASHSKRGLLYEAICNAKKFTRNSQEVKRKEIEETKRKEIANQPSDLRTIDSDVFVANKRKKNQIQRRFYNIRTARKKYAPPGRSEYDEMWSFVNSNRSKSYFTLIENGKAKNFVML